jgi:dolichol-phosphate mannosyltransferase
MATVQRTIVIVPTYNERETIRQLLQGVFDQQCAVPDFDLRALVVDGRSTDGTVSVVEELRREGCPVDVLEVEQPGLGVALLAAHRHAIEAAGADVLVQMDADLSHDPACLPALLGALQEGYDLAIGSRYVTGGGTRDWPLLRLVLSRGANAYIRIVTGRWGLREWTSGYRAFRADLYKRLDVSRFQYEDYTVQPALIYEAVRVGARIKEVPIVFANRGWGFSKAPLATYTLRLLKHFLARLLPWSG